MIARPVTGMMQSPAAMLRRTCTTPGQRRQRGGVECAATQAAVSSRGRHNVWHAFRTALYTVYSVHMHIRRATPPEPSSAQCFKNLQSMYSSGKPSNNVAARLTVGNRGARARASSAREKRNNCSQPCQCGTTSMGRPCQGGGPLFGGPPPPIRPHSPHLLTLTSPHPWSSPFLTTYPLHGSLDWP